MKKFYKKKDLMDVKRGDSVLPHTFRRDKESANLLLLAVHLWDGLDDFRKKAKRYRDYTFGKQWEDKIKNPYANKYEDGYITEGDLIKAQGKVPLKSNMIRPLLKSVLGNFSANKTEPVCVAADREDQKVGEMMSAMMKQSYINNELWELDRRTLEQFLVSAVVAQKVCYTYNPDKGLAEAYVYPVNYNKLFFDDSIKDPRLWDCSVVGEIHDYTYDDLIANFASHDYKRGMYLKNIYRSVTTDNVCYNMENLTSEKVDNLNALIPEKSDMCRVIEIWKKVSQERLMCHDTMKGEIYKVDFKDLALVEKENAKRVKEYKDAGFDEEDVPKIEYKYFVDQYWKGTWLSPYGDVIKELESPYWHNSHPYALAIYPLYDGEVHSFVEDIIDQQRYINRLITLIDFLIGTTAKGVLLFPEDQIPQGYSMDDIAQQWTKVGGIIVYKPKPGVPQPQQVSNNSTNVGAYELLNVQLSLMKEISGIYGALQGQQAKSGTAATLYVQEAQNSSTNLIDLITSFNHFREKRDTKLMKVIQQYYDKEQYIGIAGKGYTEEARHFDPAEVKRTQFQLTIAEANSTVAAQQVMNDMLYDLLKANKIDIKLMLENGRFPFADKMLASIERREEEMKAQMEAQQQQQMAMQQQMLAQQGEAQPQPQGEQAPVEQVPMEQAEMQGVPQGGGEPLPPEFQAMIG